MMKNNDMTFKSLSCRPGITFRVLLILCVSVFSSACQYAGTDQMEEDFASGSVEQRHPILVTNGGADIDILVRENSAGLNARQKRDVGRFLASYRSRGDSQINISAPAGGRNEMATYQALKDIRSLVTAYNIAATRISFRTYTAEARREAPIRLSYGRYAVQAPDCGHWSQNLAEDPKSNHHENFGCAQQRNLAAMIANPQDLVRPRAETPRSSERRDVVWDKYIKGESTISERKTEEKGTVSDVAKE